MCCCVCVDWSSWKMWASQPFHPSHSLTIRDSTYLTPPQLDFITSTDDPFIFFSLPPSPPPLSLSLSHPYLSTYLPAYLSAYLPTYLSIYPNLYLSVSLYLPIYRLSIYLSMNSDLQFCKFHSAVPEEAPSGGEMLTLSSPSSPTLFSSHRH